MSSDYRSTCWWIWQLIKTLLIFVVALLLTSPAYLVYALRFLESTNWYGKSYLYAQWTPAMILVLSAAAVNQLVMWSEACIQHATLGGREKVGQRTLYLFLLVSVVLLPSVGLTGLPYLFMRIPNALNDHNETDSVTARLRIECIFVPDSGGLFVNYVITSAFIGNAWQLLEVGRCLLWILFGFCCVRSSSEARYYAKEMKTYFPYRERYAFSLLVHTIVIAYSPVSPVIIPIGLVYFICYYSINKWALLHIYSPQRPEGSLVLVGNGIPDKYERQPPASRLYHLTWFIQASQLSIVGLVLACLCVFLFCALRLTSNSGAKTANDHHRVETVSIAALVLLLAVGLFGTLVASPGCIPVWRRLFSHKPKDDSEIGNEEELDDDVSLYPSKVDIDPGWYTPSFRHQFCDKED